MNYSYKLVISYKGTNYHGWQDQGNDLVTVQSTLNVHLEKCLKSSVFNFYAASRTDTGVHAKGQLAKLECAEIENELRLFNKLNSSLPKDIHVLSLEKVPSEFNPIKSTSKVYEYYFSTAEYNPIYADSVYYHNGELDLELMQIAASKLVGEHDFQKYSTKLYSNSVREIFSAQINSAMLANEQVHIFRIEGNGFMKYMVRRIMQELFDVGAGKKASDSPGKASAAGLTLVSIKS